MGQLYEYDEVERAVIDPPAIQPRAWEVSYNSSGMKVRTLCFSAEEAEETYVGRWERKVTPLYPRDDL